MAKKHIAINASSSGSFGDIIRYDDTNDIFYYDSFSGGAGADILLSNMTINLDTTADQTITLSGGSRYLISSVILFDANSVPVTMASDGQIWSGPLRTGTIYYQTLDSTGPIEYLDFLISADNYISVPSPVCFPPPCNNLYIISSSTLYFSLTTAGAAGLSVKMNIYGKVIS